MDISKTNLNKPDYPFWDPALKKKTKGLIHKPDKYADNTAILKIIFPLLIRETFAFENEIAQGEAREMLVDILDYALYQFSIGEIQMTHRNMFMKLIPWIIKRPEMDFCSIRKSGERFQISKELIKTWKRYSAWFQRALVFAWNFLSAEKNTQNDLADVCWRIIVYCYFLFPAEIVAQPISKTYQMIEENKQRKPQESKILLDALKVIQDAEAIAGYKETDVGQTIRGMNIRNLYNNICELFTFLAGPNELKKTQAMIKINQNLTTRLTDDYDVFLNHWLAQLAFYWQGKKPSASGGTHIIGYYSILQNSLSHISLIPTEVPYSKQQLLVIQQIIKLNPNLLTVFLKMYFPKINKYDQNSLTNCFKQLDLWFGYIQQTQGVLPPPPRFDYDFFFELMGLLLTDDHYATVSMALIFIHNYLDVFDEMARNKFIKNSLLGTYFVDLFLHWSYGVRGIFHRILAYRIVHPDPATRPERPKLETNGSDVSPEPDCSKEVADGSYASKTTENSISSSGSSIVVERPTETEVIKLRPVSHNTIILEIPSAGSSSNLPTPETSPIKDKEKDRSFKLPRSKSFGGSSKKLKQDSKPSEKNRPCKACQNPVPLNMNVCNGCGSSNPFPVCKFCDHTQSMAEQNICTNCGANMKAQLNLPEDFSSSNSKGKNQDKGFVLCSTNESFEPKWWRDGDTTGVKLPTEIIAEKRRMILIQQRDENIHLLREILLKKSQPKKERKKRKVRTNSRKDEHNKTIKYEPPQPRSIMERRPPPKPESEKVNLSPPRRQRRTKPDTDESETTKSRNNALDISISESISERQAFMNVSTPNFKVPPESIIYISDAITSFEDLMTEYWEWWDNRKDKAPYPKIEFRASHLAADRGL